MFQTRATDVFTRYYRETLICLCIGSFLVFTAWTAIDSLSQKTRIYELIGQINEIQWRSAQIREELIVIRGLVEHIGSSSRDETDGKIKTLSEFLIANIRGLFSQPFIKPLITDSDRNYFKALSDYLYSNIQNIEAGASIDYPKLDRNIQFFDREIRRITTLVNTASYIQAKAAEKNRELSYLYLFYSILLAFVLVSLLWIFLIFKSRARYDANVRQFSLLFAHMTVTRMSALQWWAYNCLSESQPCDAALLDKARKRIDHLAAMVQWLTQLAYPNDRSDLSNAVTLSQVAADLSRKSPDPKPRFRMSHDAEKAFVSSSHVQLVLDEVICNARDAVKGSNEPLIGVFAHVEHRLWGRQYVVVSVRDNGVGMTKEQLGMATKPFYSTKHETNGHSGVGLYGCAQLVRAMKGKLHIVSTPGSGTCVEIRFRITSSKRSFEC